MSAPGGSDGEDAEMSAEEVVPEVEPAAYAPRKCKRFRGQPRSLQSGTCPRGSPARVSRPSSSSLPSRASIPDTPTQDVNASPTPGDFATLKRLQDDEDAVDGVAANQAKNWLAGITALIGVIATASVLSSPDASDLGTKQLMAVISLAVVGFVLLALSLWQAYKAAYGNRGAVDMVEVRSAGGLRRFINALRRRGKPRRICT